RCPSCGAPLTPATPGAPVNMPIDGQLELPQRPSPYAETVLSQQGAPPTPGAGLPTSVSDPAGRVLAAPAAPAIPSNPMGGYGYGQAPQTPATPPGAYGGAAPMTPRTPVTPGYAPTPSGFPGAVSGGYGQPQGQTQQGVPSGAYQPAPQYQPPSGYAYTPPQTPQMAMTPMAPSTPLTPPTTPGYGQPPAPGAYGQTMPAYPPPGYPPVYQQPPVGSQPPRRNNTLPIIIGVVVVVALLIAGVFGVLAARGAFGSGTPTAHATATPQPTATGTVYFQDNFTSTASGWSNDSHCFYGSGGYHIKDGYVCFAPPRGDVGANYTISVTVKEVSGSNDFAHGLTLRISGSGNSDYYNFGVDDQGDWVFFKDSGASSVELQGYTSNSAIKTGLNVSNALKVVARGSTFTCYVNNTQVGVVHNSAFSSGRVGLFSDKYEAVFNDFLVTKP
ncbi:MAG TPA: hypothetical protein VKQ36_08635, partial [Ktedonobacterales bacterium]|nr:hypothetical protein [Ktedonobacterales bacterium]